MSIYQENILDHYKNPRQSGVLDNPDVVFKDHNPACGDEIEWHVNFNESNIAKARFTGRGCAISQAAASMLAENLDGKSAEEIVSMDNDKVMELLGIELSAMRVKCALLGLKALQKAIIKWRSENE
ncbi:Fe-S cluster assembly sulfur transfer protein SufU [Nanoarchaeota archaeon]